MGIYTVILWLCEFHRSQPHVQNRMDISPLALSSVQLRHLHLGNDFFHQQTEFFGLRFQTKQLSLEIGIRHSVFFAYKLIMRIPQRIGQNRIIIVNLISRFQQHHIAHQRNHLGFAQCRLPGARHPKQGYAQTQHPTESKNSFFHRITKLQQSQR